MVSARASGNKIPAWASNTYIADIVGAGVRIFLYEKPTVLHSKHFTVDDDVAVVGSSNMDMRSFTLNFEASLLVRGKRFELVP